MAEITQSEKPIEAVKDASPVTQNSGDAKVEDASPQVTENAPDTIPKVKHNEQSDAPAAKPNSSDEKKSYPGGERFDPTALPKSDDAAEIRKQVEFYFSDSNLTTDKFLYTMISENEGWADLRSVANFKRMRRFQPYTAVVEAMRTSTELDVDESGEKIRRKTELKPFTATNGPVARSVYVKNLPEETKTMQVDLEKYFEQYGKVKVVRLRRTDEGLFKGSVFVEFSTLEEKDSFLQKGTAEEKLKYDDAELEVMSKKAYLDMKEQQYGGKFPQNNSKRSFNAFAKDNQKSKGTGGNRDRNGGRGRGRGRGRGGRDGDRNAERRRNDEEGEAGRGEKRSFEQSNETSSEPAAKVAKTNEASVASKEE
ncbi:Lupus La protein [Taphrina deformans PYCC 5710]|uniref:Lupus La protein n=1 Tax=Taphrina deformans (strain PYCC 5710 / ATCC 11124 / CBS 356.35 / IMI 108563 / JCM 9778 / NBRC 8474) TaxID=1097556 RepID=R4XEV8_TAPDE|nr:Lupus La protein [Taphrina deformans PYCC 5710]|eukprot:CCG83011.1 Lupus La protein [Taphrina deformans PYCC 5710]